MIVIKQEVSNTVNEDVSVKWFFCDTKEEVEQIKKDGKKAEDQWNYKTTGAVSMRHCFHSEYTPEQLLSQELGELEGMKLKDIIKLIKHAENDS